MAYCHIQEGVSVPALFTQIERIPARPGEGGKRIPILDLRAQHLGINQALLSAFAGPGEKAQACKFAEFRKLALTDTLDIDPVLTRIVLGGREESVGDIIRRMEMVVKARKWPICQPEASNSNLNKVVLLAHSMGNDIWLYRKKVLGSEAELQKEVRLDKALDLIPELDNMELGPEFWACGPADSILPTVREIREFQSGAIVHGGQWCLEVSSMKPEEAWATLDVVMQAMHNEPKGNAKAAKCAIAEARINILLFLTRPKLAEYLRRRLDLQYSPPPAVPVAVSSTPADLEEAPSSSHAAGQPETAGEASDGSDGTAASNDGGDEGTDTSSSSFGDEDIDVVLEEEMARHRQMCEASVTQAFRNLRNQP